jgi:hypothetical protein
MDRKQRHTEEGYNELTKMVIGAAVELHKETQTGAVRIGV